jgi:4-amino-4-deoxy-L-arabinose transferase-like glycosyltransferase
MKTLEAIEPSPVKTASAERDTSALAWICCALAIAGGIGLRFANLSRQSLWFDEGYTAWVVSNPVKEIVRIIRVDTAPPLFYILLRFWTHLFGYSESALRSMSALMSSIGLVFFFLIARKIFRSPWTIAIATALFAVSFMQISYAHEARFYAMMSMMGAIDFYLVMLVCQRSSAGRLLAVTIAWAVSLWTNNMMTVDLACLGLAWLVLPGERKLVGRLKDATLVTVVSGLSFLPWLPTLLAQTRQVQAGFWPSRPELPFLYRTIAVIAGVHEQSLRGGDQQGFARIVFLLMVLLIVSFVSARGRRLAAAFLCFGFLPIGLIYIYSRVGQSIFIERAFIASGIVMPLLIVLPMELWQKSRPIWLGAAALMLYLSLASISGHRLGEHTEDWRGASRFADRSAAAHRLVICVSSDGETLYRYYGCDRDYGPRSDVTAVPASFFALNPPRTMQRVKSDQNLVNLKQLLNEQKFDEVVLIYAHQYFADPPQRVLLLLQSQLLPVEDRVFTGFIHVYRFRPH